MSEKPVRMYMVRGPRALAPAYGIAYDRKTLAERLKNKRLPDGFKIVRVAVSEHA